MLAENYEDGMFDHGMRLGRVTYYNQKRGFGFVQDLGLSGKDKMGIRFFHTGRAGYCLPEVNQNLMGSMISHIVPNSEQVYPKVGDKVTFWNDPRSPDWGKVQVRCLALAKSYFLAIRALAESKPDRNDWRGEAPYGLTNWWVDTHTLEEL